MATVGILTAAAADEAVATESTLEEPANDAASEDPSSKEVIPAGSESGNDSDGERKPVKKDLGFFAIMVALSLTGLLTALEATITSTALPTIIGDIGGGDLYVWVVNGYYLTQTAFQPLIGQLANTYGRRWPIMICVAVFIVGSGVGGGANHIAMLIAGRLIQGLGSGGMTVLIEIIICDLVSLRERGKYLGVLFGLIAVGTACGPLFGGLIVQYTSWRWVVYLNLPVGGSALVVLFVFLRVKSDRTPDYLKRLLRIDWIGNAIFVTAVVSILIALSWGGSTYPWSSYRVIVPLILGFVGFGLFAIYEASPFCASQTVPLHHFSNRTSSTAFVLTFFFSLLNITTLYFLPIYFQAALLVGPTESGIHLLPTILCLIPGAMAGGAIMSKAGRYRPLQHAGFALSAVGFGLLTLLGINSSTGTWVGLQLPGAIGAGLAFPCLLPAVQASLPDDDIALSTSTWSFIRSFGQIMGATIPVAAFDNEFNRLLKSIKDPAVAAQLANGQAYERATRAYSETIANPVTREQVRSVYVQAVKTVWWVALGFAGLAFLLVIIQKEIKLREEVVTKFGQEERKSEKTDAEHQGGGEA